MLRKEFNDLFKEEKPSIEQFEAFLFTLEESYSHLLTVYDDKSNLEIDVAIFSALLKKFNKESMNGTIEMVQFILKKQVNLALDFNRCDIAKSYIFTDDFDINLVSIVKIF